MVPVEREEEREGEEEGRLHCMFSCYGTSVNSNKINRSRVICWIVVDLQTLMVTIIPDYDSLVCIVS